MSIKEKQLMALCDYSITVQKTLIELGQKADLAEAELVIAERNLADKEKYAIKARERVKHAEKAHDEIHKKIHDFE